ncbi:pyrroline-5-carboxylate reductase [Actinokineospora baliensis]|uniref:pyrroline-5-carboxylate reductase family protein n=1 Tax=Actinokineospora baliensis TaxID=547056 RepID=UPI0019590DE4|nr:pyrroline-5-carboxylate reductase dimerization domain-containing protein [Actinokineospora baliensis]MBM7775498.1 pyrroline-5-carboxylate reductase [Actinokineospora baliensis]
MAGRIGLIGAGNSARALARGWGEPVLSTDAGSGRARRLVAEVGGEVPGSNRELAERAAFVVLCHKPEQLDEVAAEIDGHARAVVSALAGVTISAMRAAYPNTPVLRVNFNLPVEVRQGMLSTPPVQPAPDDIVEEVIGRFAELGTLIHLEERLFPVASMVSGVGPAYLSLWLEAQIDSAVRHGLDRARATTLAIRAMAGTAALLERFDDDPVALRRAVTSPGGVTASGLAVLEKAGLRAAVLSAAEEVGEWMRRRA